MALPSLAQREALLVEELSRRGFNPAQKAAILGSIKAESGLDPAAQEPGGPDRGFGLFQWSFGRRAGVPKLTGDYATDVGNQLDYFKKELLTSEKEAGQVLLGAKDLNTAARGMKMFERYGVAGNRYPYMEDYAKRLGAGEFKPLAAATGGDPTAGADWASVLQQGLMEGPAASAPATAQRPVGADLADVMVNAIGAGPRAGAQRSAGDALVAAILGDQGGAKPEELKLLGPELVAGLAAGGAGAPAQQVGQKLQSSGGTIGIVDLGKRLQQLGFQVREHSAFGGVGKHSPNSHHYRDNALDLTIQPGSPLLAGRPDSDWRKVKSQLGEQLRAALPGAEIFHPGYDPVGGHSSHIHLALPKGQTAVTDQLAGLLKLG